ncbi:HAD family hydrolase [Candidatus Synchoanobacter obligatus]|uniref:phosphoglycolate phosphatase n=1 Tax=Candidatus Synchoanobacter obligatus TaxID=2919597 RepID=A0ABT1L484_9GAMM|nr:HAD family hydrolase [Candidatus Synchoanobacter obligatus]MCP8351771.1 HAD family hydrolase [Candidatus Synchoanobacter obligatus]
MPNASHNTPKLICFDWDGTLIDSFEKIAVCVFEAAKEKGFIKVSKSRIKSKIGLSFEQLLYELYGEIDCEGFIECYHRIYHQMAPPLLFPRAKDVLKISQESGIQVAIVTNKSRVSVEEELKLTQMSRYIDSIWVAEEYAAKPSPIMLHHAMTSHQLTANDVWMVGDSLPDAYAGCAAGMKVILIGSAIDPSWAGDVETVSSIEDVLTFVAAAAYQE